MHWLIFFCSDHISSAINDLHEIDGQMLAVGEMTTRETRKAVRDKCRPVVTNDEPHKTFQPIGRDSVSNLYNKKRDTLLNLAVELDSEIIVYPEELSTLKDIILLHPEGFCRIDKLPYYEHHQLHHHPMAGAMIFIESCFFNLCFSNHITDKSLVSGIRNIQDCFIWAVI